MVTTIEQVDVTWAAGSPPADAGS
eukprot:SAG31_NODE_35802_length_319_cov_1.422727_2_plen_23_part_01